MRLNSVVVRYGLAILAIAMAALLTIVLRSLDVYAPLSLFVLAVAISTWFGGRGPGALAIALSALAIDDLFYALSWLPVLRFPTPVVPLLEFIVIATTITGLTDSLRTSRERARENLALLEALFAASPVGLAFLDRDLCYLRANKALADLQGVSLIAYGQRLISEVSPKSEPSELQLLRHVLASGEPVLNREVTFDTSNGRMDVLATYYPVRTASGRQLGVGAVLLDISARKQAEESRDRIANELELLVESTGEGIYQIDRHGHCTLINRAATKILGYEPDEVLGKNMHQVIHYRHPDGTPFAERDCPIFRVMVTGQGVRIDDDVFERRDGASIPVEYSSFPIRVQGRVEGAVVTFADITDRKQAEAARNRLSREQAARIATETERRQLETILEQTPSGIIYVDAATLQIRANRALEDIFGRRPASELGIAQYVNLMRHPNGRPFSVDELPLSMALRGETVPRHDLFVVQPNGRHLPVQVNATPVRDGEGHVIGAVAAFEDVSAQRDLERLREEWISLIAHDLRQPVSVIIGYADLVTRQAEAAYPDLLPRIGHIRTSAYQLDRLISDLLDVSRIESKRLTLKRRETDLVALISEVLERLTPVTGGRPVRLEVTGKIPAAYVDPARVEQVLTNLISNAVKYGAPNTEIVVSTGCADAQAFVAVTNLGPGILPEDIPRLFTRFFRASAAKAGKVAGLGLGLYISRELVEAHGGTISVESVPGETTTFRFTLPLAERPAAPASQ